MKTLYYYIFLFCLQFIMSCAPTLTELKDKYDTDSSKYNEYVNQLDDAGKALLISQELNKIRTDNVLNEFDMLLLRKFSTISICSLQSLINYKGINDSASYMAIKCLLDIDYPSKTCAIVLNYSEKLLSLEHLRETSDPITEVKKAFWVLSKFDFDSLFKYDSSFVRSIMLASFLENNALYDYLDETSIYVKKHKHMLITKYIEKEPEILKFISEILNNPHSTDIYQYLYTLSATPIADNICDTIVKCFINSKYCKNDTKAICQDICPIYNSKIMTPLISIKSHESSINFKTKMSSLLRSTKMDQAIKVADSMDTHNSDMYDKQLQAIQLQAIQQKNQLIIDKNRLADSLYRVAILYIDATNKYKEMAYNLEHFTKSYDYNIKQKELETFGDRSVMTFAQQFSILASSYADKYGENELRNLAIEKGFINVLSIKR